MCFIYFFIAENGIYLRKNLDRIFSILVVKSYWVGRISVIHMQLVYFMLNPKNCFGY